MGAYYNNKANEMIWLYTKVEAADTCLHVRDVCVLLQKCKQNEMIHTQKWKHQHLSYMCKVYAHYNTKTNEMKLVYTKVEAAATCLHVRDVCVL